MSWTALNPIIKTSGTPMASAQVRVRKDGRGRIVLFLAGSLYEEIGSPSVASVLEGSGDDAGCIMLDFMVTAGFAVGKSTRGGARLTLPVISGVAEKNLPTMACRVVSQGTDALVLRLPLAEWDAAALPARPPTRAAAPSAAPMRQDNGKVDALPYLETKGHKIQRLAGGRLQIDGELHTPDQVLHRINTHREKAELPKLALGDLHIA